MFDASQWSKQCRDTKTRPPLHFFGLICYSWEEKLHHMLYLNSHQITTAWIIIKLQSRQNTGIFFFKFYYILLGRLSKWHTCVSGATLNMSFRFFLFAFRWGRLSKWLFLKKSAFMFLDQNQMWWPSRLWEPKKFMFWPKKRGAWHQGTYR